MKSRKHWTLFLAAGLSVRVKRAGDAVWGGLRNRFLSSWASSLLGPTADWNTIP